MRIITKERISRYMLCMLLSLAMIITLTPVFGTSVHAGDAVSYMKWDEAKKELVSATCESYTKVTATGGTEPRK